MHAKQGLKGMQQPATRSMGLLAHSSISQSSLLDTFIVHPVVWVLCRRQK